jgi:multiple sugar transport system substrate-binding protein
MRTRRGAWIVGLLSAAVAAGGGGVAAARRPAPAPVQIQVWNYATGYEAQAFEAEIALFNRSQHRIHVNWLGGVTLQKVTTAISGGTPPNLVDLAEADPLPSWAAEGAVTNLTPYLRKDHVNLKEFVPGALAYASYKNQVYGLPGAFDGNFLYYNTTLLAKAGIKSPPRTFTQLWADAQKLTVIKGGKLQQVGFVPNGGIGFAQTGLMLWAYDFGGSWWNQKTGKLTPTNPGNVAALTFETSYYKKYGYKRLNTFNSSSFGSGPLGSDPFAFGKVAMEVGGEWLRDFLAHYAPKIKFGETTLPVPKVGDKPGEFVDGDLWIIPAHASHVAQTLTFLLWLEQPAHYDPILNKMVNLPQFAAQYQNDSWAVPALRASIALERQYTVAGIPSVPDLTRYETGIASAEQNATYGRMSPKAALAQLAREFANGAPVP